MTWDEPGQYHIAGKQVTVFPAKTPGSPAVYLNTFAGELPAIWEELKKTRRDRFRVRDGLYFGCYYRSGLES